MNQSQREMLQWVEAQQKVFQNFIVGQIAKELEPMKKELEELKQQAVSKDTKTEKKKSVPDEGERYWVINYGDVASTTNDHQFDKKNLDQGNWRWTKEEAQKEYDKRAAIERVRRYIVENDLLEEDKEARHTIIYIEYGELGHGRYHTMFHYSPYGRIKDEVDVSKFITDCKSDLLLIHS